LPRLSKKNLGWQEK